MVRGPGHLRHDAGAAREVERDAGRFDVPSIPPRVVRAAGNPRYGLPLPIVGPPRVPGPGSGEVLSGDIAAQPGPGLGVICLAKGEGGPGFTAGDAFCRTGRDCPSEAMFLPRAPTAGRRGPFRPPGYTSGGQKTGCANRNFSLHRPFPVC